MTKGGIMIFDVVIEELLKAKEPSRKIDGDIVELLGLCPKGE